MCVGRSQKAGHWPVYKAFVQHGRALAGDFVCMNYGEFAFSLLYVAVESDRPHKMIGRFCVQTPDMFRPLATVS